MAKRQSVLRRRQAGRGGSGMAAFAVLLAVAACLLFSPPTPEDVVSVFVRVRPTQEPASTATPGISAITLPARSWYLVIADGQTVAATGALLQAEIVKDRYGELAAIEPLSTERITLRITASQAQLSALQQGAEAISEAFDLLDQMTYLSLDGAKAIARESGTRLAKLCDTLDAALRGTENPVVRGLSGLVGSFREAMDDMQSDPTPVRVQLKLAGLAQQYHAYTEFLSGESQ